MDISGAEQLAKQIIETASNVSASNNSDNDEVIDADISVDSGQKTAGKTN